MDRFVTSRPAHGRSVSFPATSRSFFFLAGHVASRSASTLKIDKKNLFEIYFNRKILMRPIFFDDTAFHQHIVINIWNWHPNAIDVPLGDNRK
ncbi:hypothetical protein BpHYR1_003869 [Brachionus plicatilis]|uniref:Uncharacterized protein n=1 Tax=Brachionus plicatilis TaxID=10195 RepID=A0A3M7PGL5_BRAPC|nr:hypothetical protein BpHYR1_003869 [Brachionus plicatilis]